jgi:1-acyl-sn-glycerol-3-phosphate acyltransferase
MQEPTNNYDRFHQLAHKVIIYGLLFPFYNLRYNFKIIGRQNIPQEPLLIVSNHYSYYDPTIISLSIKRPIAYLAKKELFDDSAFGKLISFLGAIPINRQKPGTSSIKKVKEVLKAGWPVGVFIEGTRNKSRETLNKLENGAAFLAKLGGGLTILPIGIRGGNVAFGPLEVHIGEPIKFDPNLSLEELTLKYGKVVAELAGLELKLEP